MEFDRLQWGGPVATREMWEARKTSKEIACYHRNTET